MAYWCFMRLCCMCVRGWGSGAGRLSGCISECNASIGASWLRSVEGISLKPSVRKSAGCISEFNIGIGAYKGRASGRWSLKSVSSFSIAVVSCDEVDADCQHWLSTDGRGIRFVCANFYWRASVSREVLEKGIHESNILRTYEAAVENKEDLNGKTVSLKTTWREMKNLQLGGWKHLYLYIFHCIVQKHTRQFLSQIYGF